MTISFNSNTGFTDPTLSYSDEVSEEVPHVDAEVTVQVTVLVPITFTRQQVAARVNDALHRFHAGTWHVAPVQQRADAGFERATFVAIARIPLDDLHNLAERAKEASTEGLTLGEPRVRFAIHGAVHAATMRALAVQAYRAAELQTKALQAATGKPWSVLVVECRALTRPDVPALLRAKSMVSEPSDTLDGEAQPYAQRLALSAQITLICRSEAAP